MQSTSFILGMLTVIGMAAAVLLVLGVVKIFKHKRQIKDLGYMLDERTRDLNQSISDEVRYINDRLERMDTRFYQNFEDLKRELFSYVDSRIDKLQSKKETTK